MKWGARLVRPPRVKRLTLAVRLAPLRDLRAVRQWRLRAVADLRTWRLGELLAEGPAEGCHLLRPRCAGPGRRLYRNRCHGRRWEHRPLWPSPAVRAVAYGGREKASPFSANVDGAPAPTSTSATRQPRVLARMLPSTGGTAAAQCGAGLVEALARLVAAARRASAPTTPPRPASVTAAACATRYQLRRRRTAGRRGVQGRFARRSFGCDPRARRWPLGTRDEAEDLAAAQRDEHQHGQHSAPFAPADSPAGTAIAEGRRNGNQRRRMGEAECKPLSAEVLDIDAHARCQGPQPVKVRHTRY